MSGVSDEEIMSDGAADGFSDDDFGLGKGAAGEGLMLTDLLDLKTKKDATAQKSSQPQVSKGEITARAKILRSTRKKKAAAQETALVPLLHSDSESDHSDVADDADDNDGDDDDDDDEALRSVVKAATGRDLRARQARTNAVTVTQGVGAEDILAAPVARERSGRETLDKMLSVLENRADSESAGADEGSRNLSALKKRVERLESSGKGALDAPLPDVVAGRIERAAAYKRTTRTLTERWSGVVQQNRRAATLSFPLNAPARAVHRSTADAVGAFNPTSGFEQEIDALLREGGVVGERDAAKAEEDELRGTVSREEVIARRRELARMRSLLFDYERKMKRISKIKSKRFRKIMKNEKLRVTQELDGDESDAEDAATKRVDAERRRAEERMRLRHKNTSKWVKRQLSRGETKRNPDARAAVEEQLRLHEELKRRQEGVMELSDSEKAESDREIDDIGSDVENLDEELRHIKGALVADEGKKRPRFKSGLMNMKFMQVAAERERKQALDLLNVMGSDEEEGLDEYGSDTERKQAKIKQSKSRPMARRSFSGVAELDVKKVQPGLEESESVPQYAGMDEGDAELEEEDRLAREAYEADAALVGEGEILAKPSMASLEDIIREGNDAPSGFVTRLNGRISAKTKAPEDPVKVRSAGDVEAPANVGDIIDVEDGGAVGSGEAAAPARGDKKKRKRANSSDKSTQKATKKDTTSNENKAEKRVQFSKVVSSSNGDEEVISAKHNELSEPQIEGSKPNKTRANNKDNKKLTNGKQNDDSKSIAEARKKALEEDRARMQMVASAFAGLGGADEEDFAASKNAIIENEIDKETKAQATTLLPGWGAWDGAGVRKKRKKSAFAEAAEAKLAEARGRAIGKRADRDQNDLQLSTKRSKHARALTIGAVPFPFRSKEEWEKEISVPVVAELVARKSFQNSISEKVRTRRGVAILPITGGAAVGSGKDSGKWKGKGKRKYGADGSANGVQKTSRGKRGVIERRQRTAKAREGKRRALLS